jgi:hypothetical protein
MRTFNGAQFYLTQLTNSGQLDDRYLRTAQSNDIKIQNLTQNHNFYSNKNFNITESTNIFYSNNSGNYTGYLPPVISGRVLTIKNLGSAKPLTISGFMGDVFDQSDDTLTVYSTQGVSLIGVVSNNYTGWVNLSSTQGVK